MGFGTQLQGIGFAKSEKKFNFGKTHWFASATLFENILNGASPKGF